MHALPWEIPADQVHQKIPQRLQVVSPRLLNPKMCVETGETHCAREILVISVRDVLSRLLTPVHLRQPEIDQVHCALLLSLTHDKVRSLYVAVQVLNRMQLFDSCYLNMLVVGEISRYSLIGEHENAAEREFRGAECEEILEVESEEVQDEDRVVALHPAVSALGESLY